MSLAAQKPEHRASDHARRDRSSPTAGDAMEGQWVRYRDDFLQSSPSEKITKIREGVTASVLVGAAHSLKVPQERLFRIVGLPSATAKRKIGKNEALDPMVTERLTRVAAAQKLAEDVFGDAERANAWLLESNLALAGASPLSLLDTAMGAHEVSRILNAIAYGMAA